MITDQESLLKYLELSKPLETSKLNFEQSEYTMWLKQILKPAVTRFTCQSPLADEELFDVILPILDKEL